MDFANRGNRPNAAQQAPAQQSSAQNEQPTQMPSNKPSKKRNMDFNKISSVFILFAGALLVVAVLFGLIFLDTNDETELIQEQAYQAVFLDSADGQVYFGKLDVYNDDLYRLTDIYYVRVEQPIQPEGSNQQPQANISLAKLGNELHGPQDVMFISRDKVLYWENLKDDGQVVTAITEFKANGEQTTQQSGAANQQGAAPASNTNTGTNNDTQTTTEQQTETPAAGTDTTTEDTTTAP